MSLGRAMCASLCSETLQTQCMPSNGNAGDHCFLSSRAARWLVLPCLALAALPSWGMAEGSREAKPVCILQPLSFCLASLNECELYLSLAMVGSAEFWWEKLTSNLLKWVHTQGPIYFWLMAIIVYHWLQRKLDEYYSVMVTLHLFLYAAIKVLEVLHRSL